MYKSHKLIQDAKAFAIAAHGEQMYGYKPYADHLAAVCGTLLRFGRLSSPLLAAAWLHDVVEDTDVTIEEIRMRFGWEIADLVDAVTNQPGRNRAARHKATYPRIRAAGSQAVILKLADRIANVEAAIADNPGLLKMYRQERLYFRYALFVPGEADDMWMYLHDLFICAFGQN